MLKLIVAERASDENPERRTRVGQILKAYETWAAGHPGAPKSSTAPISRQDQIQTSSFAFVGKITHKQFRLETDYGTFKFELSQVFQANKVRIAPARRTDKGACHVALELRDGSHVKGRLEQSNLRVDMPYGEARTPIPLLQTVTVQDDRKTVDVVLKSDDRLKGSVDWPNELELKTAFGTLFIPPKEITRIDVCAADVVPSKGLVLHFSFDEKSDKVSDISGKGNHGAVCEAQYTLQGRFGGAYVLDGSNDHIEIANSDSLEVRKELTVAGWVKLASLGPGGYGNEHGYIVNKGDDLWWNPAFYLGFDKGSGWVLFHVCNESDPQRGGGKTAMGTTKLEPDKWYHLVGTYDGSAVKIYVNGKLEATEKYSGLLRADRAPIHLGGGKLFGTDWGNQFTVNGTIDEVLIWDRALSADEILGVYEQ